ncbi:hypothetical protein ACIQ7D_17815 [Streptomyces sp. NPDC096310]|uniref:hypothetical protein n=1 Tax=Streptomyces sp. NPDC096310 TaxID=3366082 RepID=UPI00382770A6
MRKPTGKQLRVYVEENRRLAAHRRAEADLYENTASEVEAGVTEETPEYLRLNQAVIDTEARLPKRFREN